MHDLELFTIVLDDIKLERIDILNKKHIKALKGLRDFKARKMCYDVKQDIRDAKKGNSDGNNFLVKRDEQYVGYMHISNDYNGKRVLSYIVQKKMRGKGLGKVMLTGVSDYLLDNGLASSVSLFVKHKNLSGNMLALSSGFEKVESNVNSGLEVYSRSK